MQFYVQKRIILMIFLILVLRLENFSQSHAEVFNDDFFYFSDNILSDQDNRDKNSEIFSNEILYRAQNDTIYLGQNRRKSRIGLGLWGSLYGYGGTIRPKNAVFQKSKISDFGVLFGIDFPMKQNDYFSKCFYYNYSTPTQMIYSSYNSYFNETKEAAMNHLFGLRFSHYEEGLFTLFGLNGGFDNYKFSTKNVEHFEGGGWQMGAYSEFELDILSSETWTLKPRLAFDYRWLHQGNIDNNQNVLLDSETHNAFYSDFGVRVIHQLYPVLDWQTRFSWLHDFLKSDPIYVQRFGEISGLTTPTLLFFDGSPGRNWFWFGTGLKFHYGSFLSAFLDYDLWFNKRMTTHTGSLSVVFAW
ncbi:MAG: autotransporter outer membrane beta-barrel domain-containing protein [Planctomycetaceae bacterium]|nr:autotransporter outer membrane beta-barrel domain-containing protein [Planctomycetaceae bacterium]